jgi:hypothetical protein
MTKGRVALPLAFVTVDDEQQVPPLRSGRDDNSVSGRTKEQVEEAKAPGSFDSAPQALCNAIKLSSAPLRMTGFAAKKLATFGLSIVRKIK